MSVTTLTGDNAVLQKTVELKDKNKKATIKEQRKLAQIEASMNKEGMEYKAKDGYDRETDTEKGARNIIDYAAVSKQGVQACNYIFQTKAKEIAKK